MYSPESPDPFDPYTRNLLIQRLQQPQAPGAPSLVNTTTGAPGSPSNFTVPLGSSSLPSGSAPGGPMGNPMSPMETASGLASQGLVTRPGSTSGTTLGAAEAMNPAGMSAFKAGGTKPTGLAGSGQPEPFPLPSVGSGSLPGANGLDPGASAYTPPSNGSSGIWNPNAPKLDPTHPGFYTDGTPAGGTPPPSAPTGATAPTGTTPTGTTPPAGSAAPSGGLGPYAGQLEGFGGEGKLTEANPSPKYQFAQVASHYNPREGVTPAMLADLNKLGIGTFSGSGDHLHIDNPSPEFEGITDFDVVRAFHDATGNGGWTWQPEGQGGGAAGMGDPARQTGAGSPLGGFSGNMFGVSSPMLGGNPIQSIEAMINDQSRRQMIQQLMGLAPGWQTPGTGGEK